MTEKGNLDAVEAGLAFAHYPSSPLPSDLVAHQEELAGLPSDEQAGDVCALVGPALYQSQRFERELAKLQDRLQVTDL